MNPFHRWWGLDDQQKHDIDWKRVGQFGWLLLNCMSVLDGGNVVPWPQSQPPLPKFVLPRTPIEAAQVLGVSVDATPEQIRAAWRAKMINGAHPDHGGGDEDRAKQLNVAKTLLVAHARRRRS